MILVTGANGYIGSHLCHRLAELNEKFVGVDTKVYINRVSGEYSYDRDIRDYHSMKQIFRKHSIDTIIHLAAYKSIPESVDEPEKYFQNNINCTTNLLLLAKEFKCRHFVFSSTCAVYGDNASPVTEDSPMDMSDDNPYALSKYICEGIIQNSKIHSTILRYFNPIGEYYGIRDFSSDGINTAIRRARNGEMFKIYGGDYKTVDGTPERDFIDIRTLVEAHIHAMRNPAFLGETVNVGLGRPRSVKQLCEELGIKYEIVGRREGDVPSIWASTQHYEKLMSL